MKNIHERSRSTNQNNRYHNQLNNYNNFSNNKNENKELLKNSQGFYSSIQTIKIPINKSQVNHYKFKY